MNIPLLLTLALSTQTAGANRPAPAPSDPPIACSNCDEWNRPQTPFKLHGRSYYVGVRGLSSILIQTSAGLILLDGGLPQSAPLIEANIRSLGLRVEDIKLIVNSHAHYDHAGGIARLQRDSGAAVAASRSGAQALRSGMPTPDDPQFDRDLKDGPFPKVQEVKVVEDGEELRVGDTAITARLTPGHTPGSTTWTWTSCAEGKCMNMVYADSLSAVSNDGYRFLGDSSHPDTSEAFRRSIALVAALPCDIMVSTHPGFSGLFEKLERRADAKGLDPMVDPAGCSTYAASATVGLDKRLTNERTASRK